MNERDASPVRSRAEPGVPIPGDLAEEVSLWDYYYVLRRRWWLVALCAVLAAGAAWLVDRWRPDLYTAEVTLQNEGTASPLDVLGGPVAAVPVEALGSQVEILRSRAVLGPVVDDLGLQLVVEGAPRGALFSAVEVDAVAPAAGYVLTREGPGFVLRREDREPVVARAEPGGWLEGPGFRVLIRREGEPEAGREPGGQGASDRADAAQEAGLRPDASVRLSVLYREEAIERLEKELKVQLVRQTRLIRVRYTDRDPELAAAVVNGVARAYQAYGARRGREQAARRREFIARQLEQIYDSLQAAQQVLLAYQDTARTLNPELEAQPLWQALMEAETEVRQLRFQENVLEGLVVSLRAGRGVEQGFQRALAVGEGLMPGAREIYRRLQELEAERSRLTASRIGRTEADPRVQVVDSLIAATRQEIRGLAEEGQRLLRARREEAEARERRLRTQVGELPARSSAFARLQQRVDAVQDIFDMLVEKFYEAQIAEAVEIGDVDVVAEAPVPVVPDPKRTRRNVLLALIVGLMIGVGGVFLLEHADTSVRHAGEVERAVGRPILAYVPRLELSADGAAGPILLRGRAGDPGAEAFRMLRTHLRFARAEALRVVAVTSPGPEEGKSTAAGNLALAYAQEGRRVLLMDADLRRSSLHDAFGVPERPGLSDVLVGEASLEDGLRTLPDLPDLPLALLPAGTSVASSGELLGSPAFGRLMAGLRERFDVVVLDTPPVLAVADPLLVGSVADGVLLVARVNWTDRGALSRAASELRGNGIAVLGVVLNAVPRDQAYRRYAGYGGYYYYPEYYDGRRRKRREPGLVGRLFRGRGRSS